MKLENIQSIFVIIAIILVIAFVPYTAIIVIIVCCFLLQDLFKKKGTDNYSENLHRRDPLNRTPPRRPEPVTPQDDPLKAMGDKYERYIGEKLEEKGEVVIYNGFIMGHSDQGVDLISISPAHKTINLIQCKNWKKMNMGVEVFDDVYNKLSNYFSDYVTSYFSFQPSIINSHASKPYDEGLLKNLMTDIKNSPEDYTIRKTLYASSEHVVDLEVGRHVEMIKPNIFRYKEMKIVFTDQSF